MKLVSFRLGALTLAIQCVLAVSNPALANTLSQANLPELPKPEKTAPDPNLIINDSNYRDGKDLFTKQWNDSGNSNLEGKYYLSNITITKASKGGSLFKLTGDSHLFNSSITGGQVNLGSTYEQNVTDSAVNVIVGNTGTLQLNSGSTAYGTNVLGGSLSLRDNSKSYQTFIGPKGEQTLGGNSYAQATIVDGGTQTIDDNDAVAKDTKVIGGGQQIVWYGTAKNTHIADGGYQQIGSAMAEDTFIYDGGYQATFVYDKVNARNTTIYQGGTQRIRSGSVENTIIDGLQIISNRSGDWDPASGLWQESSDPNATFGDDPTAINSTINSNGLQLVEKYGTAKDTTVNGGQQTIKNGGKLNNTTIQNNGKTLVEYRGYAQGLVDVKSGTLQLVAGDSYGSFGKSAEQVALNGANAELQILHNDATSSSIVGIHQLTMNQGKLGFTSSQPNQFSIALVDRLSGQGDILMNTNIAANKGDFLAVPSLINTGDKFTVSINDQGSGLSDQRLHLISADTNSLADSFSLNADSRYADHGAYMLEYLLEHETDTSDNNIEKWYLSSALSNHHSASADAVMAMADVTPSIWDTELSTLRQRLGELDNNHSSGVWGRAISSRYKVDKDSGAVYKHQLNGFVLGADQALEASNGMWHIGAMGGYSRSDIDFKRGGKGNVDSYTLAAYASYFADSGWYTDSVIKYNYFKHDTDARTGQGAKVSGTYNVSGLGASFELGKKYRQGNAFASPYVLLSGFYAGSKTYRLDNNLKAEVGSARSLKSELGSLFGYNLSFDQLQLQPYVKLAVNHEFVHSNKVYFDDQHRFANDMSGTGVKVGIGANVQIKDKFSAYGEVNHMQGKDVSMPYSLNLGLRYSF